MEDLHRLYERLSEAERYEKRMLHAEAERDRFQGAVRVASGFIRVGRPDDALTVLDGELRSWGTDLTGILSALDRATPEELAELGLGARDTASVDPRLPLPTQPAMRLAVPPVERPADHRLPPRHPRSVPELDVPPAARAQPHGSAS